MMQRSVWFLLVCGGLLVGCGGGSGGSTGKSGTGSAGEETPVVEDGGGEEGGEGSEGEGSGGEGSGGSEGSGGEGSGGEGSGGEGGGGETPVVISYNLANWEGAEIDFSALGTSFNRIQSDFFSGTEFTISSFPGAGTGPAAGSLQYTGQLFLRMGTYSPLVYAEVTGDAELTMQLSDFSMSGNATGFLGRVTHEGEDLLVSYVGDVALNGGQNEFSTSAYDEVVLSLSGELSDGRHEFQIDGIIEGYFRDEGTIFRGDASLISGASAGTPGNINVDVLNLPSTIPNAADAATAILYLEQQ